MSELDKPKWDRKNAADPRTQWRACWKKKPPKKTTMNKRLDPYEKARNLVVDMSEGVKRAYALLKAANPKRHRLWSLFRAYSKSSQWGRDTAQLVCSLLDNDSLVMTVQAEEVAKLANADLLTLAESRRILAACARGSPLDYFEDSGELKPAKKLSREARLALKKIKNRSRKVTKDGDTDETVEHEVETIGKVEAIRLEAELAGHLGKRGSREDQPRDISVFFIEPLQLAKPEQKVLPASDLTIDLPPSSTTTIHECSTIAQGTGTAGRTATASSA
jgi:hypothetical protein